MLQQIAVAIAPPGQEGRLRQQEKVALATLTPQTGWWFKVREKDLRGVHDEPLGKATKARNVKA